MKEEVEAGKERKGRRQKKSFTSFSVHGHPLYWGFCSGRKSIGSQWVTSYSPLVTSLGRLRRMYIPQFCFGLKKQ